MRLSRAISRATLFVASAAIACGLSATADATTFRSGADDRNEVSFRSKAPLETITGKTSQASAEVTIGDVENLSDHLMASITVDLASLDTGIKLRDEHMRDRFLETDKYPDVVFTLDEVVSAYTTSGEEGQENRTVVNGLQAGVETHLVANGTLTMHGVTRDITVDDLSVTYYPQGEESKAVFRGDDGDMLILSGSVSIKLSDYEIKRPRFVVLKLADDVQVSFAMALGTGVAGADGSMAGCGGCGGCGDAGCGDCGDAGCGGCGDAGCGGCGDAGCGGCGDAGCGDAGCGDAGCGA